MKKRLMALTLVTAMVISACGGGTSKPEGSSADNSQGASSETSSEAAETTAGGETAANSGEVAKLDWSKYDELIKKIYTETDAKKREAYMHEAEDMLMNTGAVLPLYYYNDLYMEKAGIEGNYANVFGTKYFMYTKKDGKNIDVFKLNIGSEPAKLDPQLNTTSDGGVLATNTFVGLYVYDKDGKLIPALAEGEPTVSDDKKEYTIKLKPDLKWSDGSTLNANDFVYSWKRAADPKTASDYSYLFDNFEKTDDGSINVSAPDDNTLTFKLTAPVPYIMDLMAFPTFMPVPQKAVEAAPNHDANPGAWAAEAGFVSNGAYTLKEWKHDESMVYVKNPNFYDADNVTVNELNFMLSADDTAILAAYQSGDVEFIDTVPIGEIPNLKKSSEFKVSPMLGTYFVCFNVNSDTFKGKTAEQASDMRKALAYLVDREYIIESVAQTDQELATSFVPSHMSDGQGGEFKANDADYTYPDKDAVGYYPKEVDIDKAVELLKKAGFEFDADNKLSPNTPINIKYLTNKGTGHENIAQALQQDFAAIGINMEIAVEDWQTFTNDRKVGNFDVARHGWVADYNDPVNMLEIFLSTSGNNAAQLGK